MRVAMRFFALLRERLGTGTRRDVAPGTTAGGLWQELLAEHPELRPLKVRIAVNERYVEPSHPLEDDDEVAFFPPVSGGR